MNKRLLILNGLSILAVIANHATNYGYLAMFWWTDRYQAVSVPNYDQMGSFSYYFVVALQKLALFCVPAFLFVTGVFLTYMARSSQARLTFGMVWRRVLNLLPPYVIWTVVYFLAGFVLGDKLTPVEYLVGLVTIEQSPYFFVPLIIVYYLISPILVPIAQKHWKTMLGAAGLILAAGVLHSYLTLNDRLQAADQTSFWLTALPHGKIFEYFFYYALGMVAGFHNAELKLFLARYKWLLLGLAVVSGVVAVVESEWVYQATESIFFRSRTLTLPTALYSITFILSFLAFEQFNLPFSNQLFKLGGSTLGIYLIHKLPLRIAPKILYHVLPALMAYQVLYLPVLITISVVVPLLMMEIVRRSPVKSVYRTIFG